MYTIHPSAIQLLVPLYNSPQRHYHDLNHINFGLSKYAEYRSNNVVPENNDMIISYSWWFHDAIYSPYPYYDTSSNEKESSKLFDSWLYENTNIPLYNKIKLHNLSTEITTNIRATELHLEDTKNFKYASTPILLDIDMAGFGRNFLAVYKDSEKIFKEYVELGMNNDLMIKARIYFFSKLLTKSKIYHTDYFYDTYEKIARDNIEACMEQSYSELQV